MNNEPIGLYIFRLLCSLGILAFMAMLYWSSLIVEERLGTIHSELAHIENTLTEVEKKISTSQLRPSTQTTLTEHSKNQPNDKASRQYPNLLTEDPFYVTTLPQLLGTDFKPLGTFRNDTLGKPDNLHPFSNWSQVSQWQNLCIASLTKAHFGKYGIYAPDIALRIEERPRDNSQATEFWVFLRDDVYWQPLNKDLFPSGMALSEHFLKKHQVTSKDFKLFLDAVMNPYVQAAGAVALRTIYNDLESIEIIDDTTFVIRWKVHSIKTSDGREEEKIKFNARALTCGLKPLAYFVYAYFTDGSKIITDDTAADSYRTNSSWAQNFTDHWARNIIVSCGGWQFDGMSDREIRFIRNEDFYNPLEALAEGMVIQFKNTQEATWQDFKSNRLDAINMQPDQIADLNNFLKTPLYKQQESAGDGIERLDFLARSFFYIGWNQAKPFFENKKVRQALTMAIDRKRIIQQSLNGLGEIITSPFYPYGPEYDRSIEPWPYDLQRARELLSEAGWEDHNGNGVIDKLIDGKHVPFEFSLVYFVKNQVTKEICEYVSTALKEIGIECRLNGVDIADLSAKFDDKAFDALCLGWTLGTPPEDPRQLWHSAGAHEKGSSNAISFSNPEIDTIIDDLDYEYDEQKRQHLYYRFDNIWHDEAPYTLLYSPKTALVYRNYLQNVFIPADRQDLVPDATVAQPDSSIFWLKDR